MLRHWGYTLCDEDTRALGRVFHELGIPARSISLNGHVAAEYFYGDRWHVIDGDQNIVYLALDNHTVASAAEIRQDPFLAIRTKPFGKHQAMSLTHSQANAALFEYITPKDRKPMKFKAEPTAAKQDSLFLGERMVYDFTRAPENPVGNTKIGSWPGALQHGLGTLEFHLAAGNRPHSGGQLTVESAHPILEATNQTTGRRVSADAKTPAFTVTIPVGGESDRVMVLCQRSLVSMPQLRKGRNTLMVAGPAKGRVRVSVEVEEPPAVNLPTAQWTNPTQEFHDEVPTFATEASAGTDKLWWQISTDPDFSFVIPNFDQVLPVRRNVALDELSATFINNGERLFFRVKARAAGMWGEWSQPYEFRVRKPDAPEIVAAEPLPDGRVRLRWKDAGPVDEFAVFGSSRLGFVPEIYAADEIVKTRRYKVEESRPNRNALGRTPETELVIAPVHFVRVIARRGKAWSTPTALLHLPASVTAALPPPVVFQSSVGQGSGVQDEYLGEERPLVPVKAEAPR